MNSAESDARSAISIVELTKIYKLPKRKTKMALDSLSLEIKQGEIFGFLGPNGAGKTTTIKTILGFMAPTSGYAEILGVRCDDPKARIHVGYLPEQPYFYKFMSPVEIVSMHAGLIGMRGRDVNSKVMEVIDLVGLNEQARVPVSKLSKGQVQRVGIAQALIGDPKILILDEPSSGLDPLGRRQVRDVLVKQRSQGRTIFLSSHHLSEIETVCDRVAVLARGQLAAIGSPDEIKEGESKTSITTRGNMTPELATHIHGLGARMTEFEGEMIITVETNMVYSLIDNLREAGLPLISVAPQRETLEDAFLRLAA